MTETHWINPSWTWAAITLMRALESRLIIAPPSDSPVICDDCVKYEKAEDDRLVAILKTNNCGGGGGADRVEYSKLPASARMCMYLHIPASAICMCNAERQYLITLQVSRYFFLALQSSILDTYPITAVLSFQPSLIFFDEYCT